MKIIVFRIIIRNIGVQTKIPVRHLNLKMSYPIKWLVRQQEEWHRFKALIVVIVANCCSR